MEYLECGALKFPLSYVQSISYTRAANVVQTHQRNYKFKGYNPQDIVISIVVSSAISETELTDVCKSLLSIPINGKSAPAYIGGKPLCPYLEFAVTSVGITPACDAFGSIQEVAANITISGAHVSKNYNFAHEDSPTIPKITLSCGGKSVSVGEGLSLLEIELHPMSCKMSLSLSEGNYKISASGWLDAFIERGGEVYIEGYGTFYAASGALRIGDELELDLSVFPPEISTPTTKTFMNTSLKAVISSLVGFFDYKAATIPVDHFSTVEAPTDALNGILRSCGLLASYRGDHLTISEVPESIPADNTLSYYIDYDLISAPTNEVIIRDGVNEYRHGDGAPIIINSNIRCGVDRSDKVFNLVKYKQHIINLTIPYEPRIRQHSIVCVRYSNKSIPCLVDDYVIDFISGQMSLTLCYI